MNNNVNIESFYDEVTNTLTYIVYDDKTKDAVIIDSVLDFDAASGAITNTSAKKVLEFVKGKELKVSYILETHAHADHLTGAQILKDELAGAKIAINSKITEVQSVFSEVFNLKELNTNGIQFDELLEDNQVIKAGSLEVKVIHTPGHTPACTSFLIGDNVFTGDLLFMPDSGTGRCDFPKGSSSDLYDSVVEKIYKLSDDTKIFVGHDYQPNGRELKFQTTVAESKAQNIQLKANTSREEFIKFRNDRDATLAAPKLLLPSIQVNIDAGILPKAEDNNVSYLKIPLRIKE